MKHNHLWHKPYRALVKRVFIQILLLAVIAVAAVLIIRSAGQGYFGDFLVHLILRIRGGSWEEAQLLYYNVIRANITYLILGTMVVFFLVLVRLMLTWFTRYFNEIVEGVDELAEGQRKVIVMSPELDFVASQLNRVNDELIRSAEAEQAAEQRKNDLVVYLAHDIKTPLTSVIGYLSLLEENTALTREQRSTYIHVALDKAYRLEELIGEFFEITRSNLDAIPLQREHINLSYLMAQIVDELHPLLAAAEKTVTVCISHDLMLFADPDKIARAFNNILKNAISYSDENSTIEIVAKCPNDCVVLDFTNAGTIPADKLETIFEKFNRLDEARQSSTGGSGLGLAIAKDIIELHGGTIKATSKQDTTHFTVTLPHI